MTALLELKTALDHHFDASLEQPVTLCRDALILYLNNGVVMEVRAGGAGEYIFAWRYGDAELRIDTAPVTHAVATYPNHLHDAAGVVRADPLTHPEAGLLNNLRSLIQAVLSDPLLEHAA